MKLANKLILCLMLLFSSFLLTAQIMSIPGNGEMVVNNNDRDYIFKYHNSTVDQLFFGTDKWAVRFNFAQAYPSTPSAEFVIKKAVIHFPQIPQDASVELFADNNGQPGGIPLRTAGLDNTTSPASFTFSDSLQTGLVWMILTYQTSYNHPADPDRFVSASSGGGANSYYLNTTGGNSYYQSFNAAGFNYELMFGMMGYFILNGDDLELKEFDLAGRMSPREDVKPVFRIINHSGQTVSDASINLTIYQADLDSTVTSIPVVQTIPPRGELVITDQSTGYNFISLPENPMQIRLKAVLTSPLSETNTANNTKITFQAVFDNTFNTYLSETFLRQTQSDLISDIQHAELFSNVTPVFYYPVLSDTLSGIQAAQRYNWYGFNTLSRTVVGGDGQIAGFDPETYSDLYQDLISEVRQERSFISSSDCRFTLPTTGETAIARVTLSNNNTHLFTSNSSDLRIMNHSRFFAGLYKKEQFTNGVRLVLDRWIAFSVPLIGSLSNAQSIDTTFAFSLSGIDQTELASQYQVLYWLQFDPSTLLVSTPENIKAHVSTRRIHYSAKALFSGGTANEELVAHPARLRAFPNPFFRSESMSVLMKTSDVFRPVQIAVYNLKGQRIGLFPLSGKKTNELLFDIPKTIFLTSGVYFIEFAYIDPAGKQIKSRTKITNIN